MIPNDATIALIKEFEGCRLTAYKDPVGVLTIGYGYTNNAGYGNGVEHGDRWTREQAEKSLYEGIAIFGGQVEKLLTFPTNPNQLGAMTSLAYNIGIGAFSRSTCLKRFNKGNITGASEALLWFNKAGGKVLRGLVRRREAESSLFLSEDSATPHRGSVDEPARVKSKTLAASTLTAVAGGAGTAISAVSGIDPVAQYVLFGVFGVIVLAALVIFRERLRKAF